MIIKLYDRKLFREDKPEFMKTIAEEVNVKMDVDITFGGFIVVNGQDFVHCAYDPQRDELYVMPIEMNTEEDARDMAWEENIICPYCLSEDEASYETREGVNECGVCFSEYEVQINTEITYTTSPYKIAPIYEMGENK